MSRKKKEKPSQIEPMSDEAYSAFMAEINRPKSAEEKEFIKLGWKLMEAKYRYYILDTPELQDHEYDQMERRYDELAKILGAPPTAVDMVGFDRNRPSSHVVMNKVDGINEPKDPNAKADQDAASSPLG